MNRINCFLLMFTYKVLAIISIIDKGILPLVKNSVGIQFFIDLENQNKMEVCKIYPKIKHVCLTNSGRDDCGVVDVYSEKVDVIKPKDRKTYVLVLPAIYQHDLVGFCNMIISYRCPRASDVLRVHIPFNFKAQIRKRTSPLLKDYIGNVKVIKCGSDDQNCLDNCAPTDCDLKYHGQRPFYDANIRTCIETPICLTDGNKEFPNVVIIPEMNICKDLDVTLTIQDMYSFNTGLGIVTKIVDKRDHVKVQLKSNCTTISQNLLFLKDLMYGKLCPCDTGDIDYKDNCLSAIFSIILGIISVCAILLSFVCCVNTSVWVHRQWIDGNIKEFFIKVRNTLQSTAKAPNRSHKKKNIRNPLLRGVVINNITKDLRNSAVSICEELEMGVERKNRCRHSKYNSQISLMKGKRGASSRESLSD